MKHQYELSKEEQEILEAFENNELMPASDFREQKKLIESAAFDHLKKSKKINIRMQPQDLNYIKYLAVQEGIPYQTLISSVLHKYAVQYLKINKAS